MSWREAAVHRRGSSPGGAANDTTNNANELVRSLEGQMTKEGDIIVASGSKSKLWRDLSFEARNTKLDHETCRLCEWSRLSVESLHQQ